MAENFFEIQNGSFTASESNKVNNVNLVIEKQGEIISLLGPSGIGKTTILRTIAGLQKLSGGKIKLRDRILASEEIHIEPEKRNVALSFQDNSLFPNYKVIDNISKLKSETWTSLLDEELEVDFKEDIFDSPQDIRPSLDNKNLNIRESLVIQQGCNHRCTFCIIPFGRGNNRSFDPFYLIDEVERVVENGVKEIVLTGVDISDYGSDFDHKYNMSNLILDILDKTKLQRLRLSSIDCVEVDENFNEVLKDQRVMPHLHLSIQSGDDMILKRMKRRHNSKDVFQFVDRCKKIRKDISFGADIIAGFPTETDTMFENTYKLLRDNEISHLHIFPFSPKNNTPASRMPQVSKSIIKKRAKVLRDLGELILKKVKSKLSLPREILIEELNSGLAIGYDQNYIKHEVPLVGVPVGEVIRI